ncbi:hypothetical protein [Pseudoduganella flava]|nr:hypothetical protein [Pseudoduganella flava]QGZ38346.1 hypothetical protein GO485_04285 [Pseudoduganella flava]
MRIIIGALAFCALMTQPALADASDDPRDLSVIGKWKLTSVLDYAEIASLDERGARKLVGKIASISEASFKLGTRVCEDPDLSAEWVEPELHLRDQVHASAENLRLPNPVTVIDLTCTIAYVRDSDHLVILWKGVLFDTVRVKADATGKKARQPQPRPAGKAEPDKVQRALMPFEAP